MPDITVAMRSLILQSQAIVDIVGSRVSSNQLAKQEIGTLPAPSIVLWVMAETALDALDGPLGMDQPIFTIQSYADRRDLANQIRKLVRNQISGFSGVVSGVFIKGVAQRGGQSETTDRVKAGSDQYRFVTSQNFRVTYDYELAGEAL